MKMAFENYSNWYPTMDDKGSLQRAFDAHQTVAECLGIVKRASGSDAHLIRNSRFDRMGPVTISTMIGDGQIHLDDGAIVSMWSHFERFIIEFVQAQSAQLEQAHPPTFSVRLAAKFVDEVERWRPAEMLDLFRDEFAATELGEIKRIKRYRDWIAHRNPKLETPNRPTPNAAFRVLSDVILRIRAM